MRKIPDKMATDNRKLDGSGEDVTNRAKFTKTSLGASDRPSEKLLNRIAQYIIYDHLSTIALELGINKAQLSCIKADSSSNARVQRFEVLSLWENKTIGVTTERVVELLVEWCKKEYVVPEVWDNIRELVDFELPTNVEVSTCGVETAEQNAVIPSTKRIQQLQKWTKESLREKPFSTVKGKIWTETPNSIPLEKIFTKLCWVKKNRETFGVVTEELSDITQLLTEQQGTDGPVRILVQAPGGMGKSTALKHLAMCWADGSVDERIPVDFIFHIALKDVQNNDSIENIIIKQHKGLSGNNVQPAEIRSVLEAEGKRKIILLLDGHDEYKISINADIDKAITKDTLRNCWIVLTSRETKELPTIREYMDAEAEITGFDEFGIEEYINKYLGNNEKTRKLLKNLGYTLQEDCKIHKILCIPFLLHMVCVLYTRTDSLPKTKTGVLDAIVGRCTDWDAIRKSGKKREKNVKNALVRLGKLVMNGLQRNQFQQTFSKEEILQAVGEEAFELGLLMGTKLFEVEEEETQMFCFQHLLFLEFIAAKYVETLDKATLKVLFPTWDALRKHQQVLQFACGLADDPQALLEIVYEHILQKERQGKLQTEATSSHFDLFSATELLSSAHLVWEREFNKTSPSVFIGKLWTQFPKPVANMEPWNNKYINYLKSNTGTVHVPSEFYLFSDAGPSDALACVVDPAVQSDVLPAECAVGINSGDIADTLRIMYDIGKYQNISIINLCLVDVEMNHGKTSEKLPFNAFQINKKIKFVRAVHCRFLPTFYKHLIQQLHVCDEIHHLDLSRTKGVPVELGEVLSTMRTLRYLDLSGIHMTLQVSHTVLSALSSCKQLANLNMSNNNLTDGIKNLLREAEKESFLCLKELELDEAALSATDVESLAKVTRGSKLKLLNISNNCVTDCVNKLLPETGYPELEQLQMVNSKLSKVDVASLSRSALEGKLPNLKVLDMIENALTDCIAKLFGDAGHPGFKFLEELLLKNSKLSRADLESLAKAASKGKLPNLRVLNLSGNDFHNSLGNLLGSSECPGFLNLNHLQLDNTKLCRADIVHITEAVSREHLPQLDSLDMKNNNLHTAEDALEDLSEAFFLRFKENRNPPHSIIMLSSNNLSDIFQKEKLLKRVKESQGNHKDIKCWIWGSQLWCVGKRNESECSFSVHM